MKKNFCLRIPAELRKRIDRLAKSAKQRPTEWARQALDTAARTKEVK